MSKKWWKGLKAPFSFKRKKQEAHTPREWHRRKLEELAKHKLSQLSQKQQHEYLIAQHQKAKNLDIEIKGRKFKISLEDEIHKHTQLLASYSIVILDYQAFVEFKTLIKYIRAKGWEVISNFSDFNAGDCFYDLEVSEPDLRPFKTIKRKCAIAKLDTYSDKHIKITLHLSYLEKPYEVIFVSTNHLFFNKDLCKMILNEIKQAG